MIYFKINLKSKHAILALGAESAGNFSVFHGGIVHFSQDFGDLADENNFLKFKNELLNFIKKLSVKPDVILHDLHPLLRTTQLAETLAKKYEAKHIPVQHHLAHIFSAIGDEIINNPKKLKSYSLESCLGIACDGTGYGLDEKIWGGEIFKLKAKSQKLKAVRIGHLENQILIGGEMAIKEPARLIISILYKIQYTKYNIQNTRLKTQEDFIYSHVKNYYTRNEFNLLFNQLGQNFNCLETSSTARILDAVSVLLGFSKNERLSKHGPVELLEKNSTKHYALKPVVEFNEDGKMWILKTTPLFEYLIRNLHKDKLRLAATAQKYIADGLLEICNQPSAISFASSLSSGHQKNNLGSRLLITDDRLPLFFAGGMANNPVMSKTLTSHGVYTNKKIPRGDAGISFGQIFYHLSADSRD